MIAAAAVIVTLALSGPARAGPFLPALEYALPVGQPGDVGGWSDVQRALNGSGHGDVRVTGKADAATLRALLRHMKPLMRLLTQRADLAEARAKEEERQPRHRREAARYGNWNASPTEGHYSGEMYFPPVGAPYPAGYVRVSGSGWPDVYEYHRAGGPQGQPLCSAVRFGTLGDVSLLACMLLDGEVRIEAWSRGWLVSFSREGEREISLSIREPDVRP